MSSMGETMRRTVAEAEVRHLRTALTGAMNEVRNVIQQLEDGDVDEAIQALKEMVGDK